MRTGQGSLDDLEKPGLNTREKTKSSYAAAQMSDTPTHIDSVVIEVNWSQQV